MGIKIYLKKKFCNPQKFGSDEKLDKFEHCGI